MAADAIDAVEKAGKRVGTVGKAAGKAGKKVGTVGKEAGKAALDAMAKVGDAELKAIEAGKTILKKFGL